MSAAYEPDRIRGRLRAVRLDRMYRLIHTRYRDHPLGSVAVPSRFGDPAGRYSVLYAAEAVRCVFWEALARNRFTRRKRRELPRSDVDERLVVSIRSTETLTLVDLRRDGPIRIAAPTAVTHDANHAAGRALSSATYATVPEADGFLFRSRFTGHVCAAIFDRAIPKLAVVDVSSLIDNADFLSALTDYEIALLTPPTLPS